MLLVKESAKTLMHSVGNSVSAKAFRNAGRFIQNAIDGEAPEFEKIPSVQPEPSQVARDIATIIENEKDMRVIAQPKASLIWQPVYGWFMCGACKKVYPNALMKYFNTCEYQPKFNFCPNCGADMREEIQ